MKNTDLIDFLMEGDEFTKKELKNKETEELQKLFDERFNIVELDEEDDIADETEDVVDEAVEDVKVVIDISKLSKFEQRHYRRTGQLPQITINKYTRFDDENPKMNN